MIPHPRTTLPSPFGAKRLCICHGTWQLITLVSALHAHNAFVPGAERIRNTLALSGERLSGDMRRTMAYFSDQLDCFADVCWIDDLVTDVSSLTDAELAERAAHLQARLGGRDVREIWMANPQSPLDRFLLNAYPSASIILFEDGLGTYGAPWSDAGPLLRRALVTGRACAKALRRNPQSQSYVLTRGVRLIGQRVRRPSAVYLILAERLGVPSPYRRVARTISSGTLREVIERFHVESPRKRSIRNRPQALILGNAYSFWTAMSREQEAALYSRIIARLASAGYDVLWKEHPRTIQPFLPELQRLSGIDVGTYTVDRAVPIELCLRYDPVDLIASGTSTSLLYVPMIFGERVRVASFAESVRPLVRGVRSEIVRIVESVVPNLDAVLADDSVGGVLRTAETHR